MQVHMMKSKLHRATVTEACLEYEGSLTVDQDLMDLTGMLPNEMVKVYNLNNGERFGTYLICGKRGSGVICLNGAAARKGQPGDRIIILTSCWLDADQAESFEPKVVVLDEKNRPKQPSGPCR